MTISRWISLALVVAPLALFPTGCAIFHPHSSQQTQPPPLQTGPGQIDQEEAKAHQPPPPSTLPQPSAQNTPPQLPPVKQPKIKRAKRKKPAETPPPETQQAQNGAPASPIGQLTTGDSATAAQSKRDTTTLIQQTEQGLNNIKRALSADERNTVVQIRTFLKQAQQALDNGDTDGAHTLATKASLLLEELTKP